MRVLHAILFTAIVLFAGVVPSIAAPMSTANEASLDRIGVWQAPTNTTDFDDASDIRAAMNDGVLARATGVNHDDTLVIGLQIHGFSDVVSTTNGSSTTERFLSAMSSHGDLLVKHTNPGPSHRARQVHVLNGTGVTVFPDTANDTYYLVVNLREVRVTYGEDGDKATLEYGPYEFLVKAELAADSALTKDRQYAVARVGSRSASIETAPDGKIHVQATSNLTISGKTNVGTGWPVTVVLTGDDNQDTGVNESFQLTRKTTVEPSEEEGYYKGSFDISFDRDTVPIAAKNVTANVRFDGQSLLDKPVLVALADRRASVTINGVGEDGNVADVILSVNASLSTGGFLVLHEESADGPVVGHTKYLSLGNNTASVHSSEPINADEVVVVAHRDANHNEWFDGQNIDQAYAEKDPSEAIAIGQTRSPTPTETTTASSPTDTTASSAANNTSISSTIPGFGVAATALALLIALAVLKHR